MGDPSRYHVEDVGRILLHAQQDLSRIRDGLTADADPRAAKQAISEALIRAEANLRLKAEAVLSTGVGQSVAALPPLGEHRSGSAGGGTAARHALIDVGRVRPPLRRPSPAGGRALPAPSVKSELAARVAANALGDPSSALGRRILTEQYGVAPPRPAPVRQGGATPPVGRLLRERTGAHAGLGGRQARHDPRAPPAPIRPEEVSKGLLSLVSRGLLPGHMDLTAALSRAPAPAVQGPLRLHAQALRHGGGAGPAYASPFGYSAANLKLDLLTGVGESLQARRGREAAEQAEAAERAAHAALDAGGADGADVAPAGGGGGGGGGDARGFDELMDTFSLHHFVIRRGELLSDSPEFASFQRRFAERWGALSAAIGELRALLAAFAVPLAFVDGRKLAQLALDELSTRTRSELLGCLVNRPQVEAHMRRPGARYAADPSGAEARAALLLQSGWRRLKASQRFAEQRGMWSASLVLARWWRFHCDRAAARAAIGEARAREQAAWESMTAAFWADWPRVRRSRRVVVHVPSLSHPERQRRTLSNLDVRQNAQMARLLELADPLVELLVYVSPFPLSEETLAYWGALLRVGGVADGSSRLRVVVPENYARFPPHVSLCSLLLHSPRALRRIGSLCRAKDGYLMPGLVGPDELRLSAALRLPLFAPQPAVAARVGSKSGSKRVFRAAQVNVPPGAHDIYTEDELLGSLAHLIAHNLSVPKWTFKLDDEFGGRGNASFLTSSLPCHAQLAAQYDADPSGWAEEGTQAAAQSELLAQLKEHLPNAVVIGCRWLFRSWAQFVAALSRSGGVIEASPLEVRSSPSAQLFVEPDGAVRLLCTHEQLLRGASAVGAAFPQTAVPHPALRDAALAIGRACFAQGVIGHVGVDFVAFVDEARRLRVWAVDLNLRLTQPAAMFAFFHFMARGAYDAEGSGLYSAQGQPGGRSLCYVASEVFYHPDLVRAHHGPFFELCRLKGISFDVQAKLGTLFNLPDSFGSGMLGVLSVGSGQLGALRAFTDCLDFVGREVGQTAELLPEPNGYVEVGLKDLVLAVKRLLDRSRARTRGAAKGKGGPLESASGQPSALSEVSSSPAAARLTAGRSPAS